MASGSEGSTASADQEETTDREETGAGTDEERAASAEDKSESAGDEQAGDSKEESDGDEQAGRSKAEAGGDEEEDDSDSGGSSTSAIEDVSALPGETVNDQDGRKIGEVKEVYAVGDDETPMWVTIESSTGLGRSRQVFVPLARIKKQQDDIRVPYSYNHIHESPEIEPGDELSEEDDRALRVYYAIGLADQELVGSARSYASQVPDDDGPARKVDASDAEGPARELDETPPAERVAEAYEKQKEEEGEEHRQGREATADDVFEEDGAGGDGKDGDEESKEEAEGESKEEAEGESKEDSKGESKDDSKGESKDDSEDAKSDEQPKAEEKADRD